MRKYLSFLLCLLIGTNVFAQQVAVKALPAPVKATLERKALGTDVVEGTVNFTATRGTQSVVVNEELEYTEAEAMYTTYDLQSNNLIANRMYQAKDGSVAVVTTISTQEYDASFADRGTGYNFAKAGDMDSWGDIPYERVEDIRTGWPTIAPYGAEGEILVNHSEGLNYWVRTVAGEGEWDGPHAIPNPDATKIEGIEEGLTLSWARVVTTGENNDVVHIFAAATGSNGYYQFYVRSTDLQEWDVQLSPLAMDDLHANFYAADDYAVAANGENIAVVYCGGFSAHVMLYESNDGGLTWNSRMVWESPIHGLDWNTDENSLFQKLYGPTQASVAIGKDGVSHVALAISLYDRDELGNSYSIYSGLLTDGIAYWNDTTAWEYEVNGTDTIAIPSPIRSVRDTELKHALRLWWDDPEQEGYVQMDLTNFCAWMPPHKEEGYNAFDLTYQYTGSEGGTAGDYQSFFGLSAYPSIAVDVYGNLAISWCSPDLNRDMYNGVYYMRTPFVKYKPANVPYWWQVNYHGISMYEDFIHTGDEATCITAVSSSVKPNEFWFSCLSDDTPGFHTGSITSQPNISTSTVNVFKFTPAEGYEGDEDFDNPIYPEQPGDDDNTTRNVLIEEFTGRSCAYCPMGHAAINDVMAENPGKVFAVNYHSQNSLSPTSYPNLNVTESTTFFNAFNIQGIPDVAINRTSNMHPLNCAPSVEAQLEELTEVKIEGNVAINPTTRQAEITVELDYLSNSNYSTNYLTIMMLQDSIWGSQSGAEYYNPEQYVDGQYCHMHVLRDVITNTWGDAIAPTTAGTHLTKTYIYEIPEVIGTPNGVEVDLDNIYFLAFVTEKQDGTPTRPVLNVNKLEPSKVPDNPEDDNTATAPSMRLSTIFSTDGLESYDYIYPSETSTRTTCVNEYDFLSNTENIDSIFYDERGNITKIATWTKIDGQWFYSNYVDYTYNDKNLRISRANYNNFGDGFELGGVYNYKYDDEGRMIEWSLKFIVDEYQKAIIEYDEEGRKISETIQQFNFETYYLENAFLTEYEYDENGNCVKEAEYGFVENTWQPNPYRVYEYDEFGNCILMEYRSSSGIAQERRIYNYDTSVLAENVFYYPNPEEDFPQLPKAKTHLLTSFDYFAEDTNGGLTFITTYVMGYEDMNSNNHWTPDESLYANNMTIITTVEIDGVEAASTDIEIGAFCNGELRGSSRLQYVASPANRYECFLMVYGNSGDDITFRLYDHSTGLESDLKSNEVVDFEVNATIGDVVNPYTINFKSTEVHTQALLSGWNWYSTYIINEGAEGLANLEATVGTNGIQIKNQTKFVNQASGNWYGTLTSTAVEDMYMIQLTSAAEISLEGYAVNPAEHPITLSTNWKWISYPVANSMSVEEAFANANPSNGDYVKSQKGFAQYYEGLGWTGTLKTMTPGMGYMYQNTSGYAKTLVYPMANAKSKAEAEVEENLHWTANATKYPMNMTVIAVVEDAARDYEVAAFSNGECRGSARPIYIEALGQSMIFMTVYGDDNDNVSFRYYDVTTGEEVALNDEMTFEVNATHGDVMEPYVMTLSTMGIDEASAGFNIYPNPVQDKLYIEAEAEIEEVVVYDVYGRRQVTETPSHQGNLSVDVSNLNSGVYFVQIKTEEGNITKRFVKE